MPEVKAGWHDARRTRRGERSLRVAHRVGTLPYIVGYAARMVAR